MARRKGPKNFFDIKRVRNKERKSPTAVHTNGTEVSVPHREIFKIKGSRDTENLL